MNALTGNYLALTFAVGEGTGKTLTSIRRLASCLNRRHTTLRQLVGRGTPQDNSRKEEEKHAKHQTECSLIKTPQLD